MPTYGQEGGEKKSNDVLWLREGEKNVRNFLRTENTCKKCLLTSFMHSKNFFMSR